MSLARLRLLAPAVLGSAVLSLAVLALSAPAQARPPRQGGPEWSVGGGVIASPRPYEGAEIKVLPVPFFGVRAGAFFFETVRLGVRVAHEEHFKADILAQARFEGYDADDAKILAGMEDRRMSVDAGVRLLGEWEHFQVELTALTDILSRHDGQEVSLGFGFPLRHGGWTITPGLGARWQSDNLVDYYYGVEPAEAFGGRPAYEGDATINPRLEVRFRKPFAHRDRWMFLAQITHEWLGDEIKDSPIVDASSTIGGHFAFIRTFR